MLNLLFSLFLFAAPMQPAQIVTQETVCVTARWRTELVGKMVYVYRNDILVMVMPLPF